MRVFFVAETKDFTHRLFLDASRKFVKGFTRLGHDAQVFSCNDAQAALTPLRRPAFSRFWWKRRTRGLLLRQMKLYKPDLVFVNCRMADPDTIVLMRDAAPKAFFASVDGEIRPESRPGRVETAAKVDLLFTVYGANGQRALREVGVKCIFMPWPCDPDLEHRHAVAENWLSDVIFTGKLKHRHVPTDPMRTEIISRLARMQGCAVYGCFNRPFLGGMDYYYAISGAKMGLSVNLANDIQLYHSDRLIHYLACGTLVLCKRVPDSERMFQEGVHLECFDSTDEFFDLVARYLQNESERKRIARAGMEWAHREFNCQKIAGYMVDAIETGTYRAPWMA